MIEHVFLIGYRAAGKTTIGGQLADSLDFEFLDTDQLVCRNRQSDIAGIVAEEGWEAFRRYEAEALRQAAGGRKRVVATGGGAILHGEVWREIRDRVFVVWLSADMATLAARLQPSGEGDGSRPSLTGNAIDREIEDVLTERIPLYREYSDLEVDTGKFDTAEVVNIIVRAYRSTCGGSDR